ncbi:MAG TPA: HD domain-containing protein [Candidatus Kapabacteria bacterium]|nr:HD domain-containing protein [Candidatus Kapabacteria bacterium]
MIEESKNNDDIIEVLSSQLANSYYQFAGMLSTISETTEKYYDGGHSRFVADKSAIIAEQLGMSEVEIVEVRIAGMLHDIGKLGFPDPLLFKFPNEMTQQEYIHYTKHAEFGYNILNQSSLFKNIAEIVYQHHEKLDGSGFPRHLIRENIHPAARIIIVVDYYHNQISKIKRTRFESSQSITNTSSYIESTKDRVVATMNYLHKKKNILFEAKVVDAFTDVMEIERKVMGAKVVMKLPINVIEPGMIFAEDYYTSYGMLIAAKGERITNDSFKALQRCIENGEMPSKILVIK